MSDDRPKLDVSITCKCGATYRYIGSEYCFKTDKAREYFDVTKQQNDWLDRHDVCLNPVIANEVVIKDQS